MSNNNSRAKILSLISADAGSGCHLWLGAVDRKGYGEAYFGGRTHRAHRLVYTILRGDIPAGLVLDHLCRNRRCVNPDHLEPVTQRENLLRGNTLTARHARATHCPKGHPYDADNTMIRRRGRDCRACKREGDRRRHAAARGQRSLAVPP